MDDLSRRRRTTVGTSTFQDARSQIRREKRLRVVSASQRTDADLLEDRRRPADSFAEFYRRHDQALLRFAASRGCDLHTAADIVAETFCAALSKRYHYKAKYESARLWLLGIAVRKIADLQRDHARQVRRRQQLEIEIGVLTVADYESYSTLLEPRPAAISALDDLPPLQRDAIRARVLEDRNYHEVAAALGLTEPAARKQVSRGLASLRIYLGRSR